MLLRKFFEKYFICTYLLWQKKQILLQFSLVLIFMTTIGSGACGKPKFDKMHIEEKPSSREALRKQGTVTPNRIPQKEVSHQDLLDFGFRDFDRSEFKNPGYIPPIPIANDQKDRFEERWYYTEKPSYKKLLNLFGIQKNNILCPPCIPAPGWVVPNTQARVHQGILYVYLIHENGKEQIKEAWLHRWTLRHEDKSNPESATPSMPKAVSNKESDPMTKREKLTSGLPVKDFPTREMAVDVEISEKMLSKNGFKTINISGVHYEKTMSHREFQETFGFSIKSLEPLPNGSLGGPYSARLIVTSKDGSKRHILAIQAPPSAYPGRELPKDYPLWKFYSEKITDNTLYMVHVSKSDKETPPKKKK